MRRQWALLVGGTLVLLGLASVGSVWNGTVGLNFGWPASANTIKFCGSASGLWALVGLSVIVTGLAILVISIIRKLLRTRA
jgi:hypothetical protein